MAQLEIRPPNKIFRGTLEEVLRHREEIPANATVELKVFEEQHEVPAETETMALMRAWLEEDTPKSPEEIRAAEEDLQEFKRNINLARKEAGARLLYPEEE